jgi:hypothetical protein
MATIRATLTKELCMSDVPHDPLPAMRAELDQAVMAAPEVARVARGFFDAFAAEGFSSQQALYLVAAQLLNTPGEPPE